MGKRVAILMGMTAYRDDRLEAPATLRDMRLLVDLLREGTVGRFDRVVPLFNQTAVELQIGVANFLEKELEPDDLILVYFAGHCLVHHQALYLAAADTFTEEYLDATTIEVEFIHRRLQACPARQVVLFDCRLSLLGATDRHTNGREMLAALFAADNRAVLVGDGVTAALAAGLQGGAVSDEENGVTAASLFAFVGEQAAEPEMLFTSVGEGLGAISLAGGSGAAAVPISPPSSSAPPSPAPASKWRRVGLAALLLLLLLAGGWAAINRGAFTHGGQTAAGPTAVPAQAAVPTNTPAPTDEPAVPSPAATIASTKTAMVTKTAVPSETSAPTHTAVPTSAPSPTATETPSPTPEPVPMDVVAQQAFLRAGPGINYRILAFPGQGTAVTVIARNSDATWFNVVLADGGSGWLYQDVIAPEDAADFGGIPVAATIPAPINDFYDPVVVRVDDSLTAQAAHTYVGTVGNDAYFQARLLPETDLIQPTYLNGQALGIGLLTVTFHRVADGAYTSNQVEFCMVSADGSPFYCETFPARKSW